LFSCYVEFRTSCSPIVSDRPLCPAISASLDFCKCPADFVCQLTFYDYRLLYLDDKTRSPLPGPMLAESAHQPAFSIPLMSYIGSGLLKSFVKVGGR
jgi:hypothetical protein